MAERESILVVDDDPAIARVLSALLGKRGLEVSTVSSAEEALAELDARPHDLVLTDVRMGGMDGVALLERLTRKLPGVPVVIMTAHGSVSLAVEAMRRGAADFVQKPFDKDEIASVVERALATSRPARERPPEPAPGGILGESDAIRDVLATVAKVAPSTATVLVRGETGTGKELVARAIHEASPRRDRPFVRVNCAAIPTSLLESELFGHERGAFTGAIAQKPGRFELAHGGTIFLDEIGDVSPDVQVKLLRVLQERELERVGGRETIRVDVRVVAATHRDLESAIASGELREDLYYRLNVVPLFVPPLRARPGDAARLARRFCEGFAAAHGRGGLSLDEGAVELLAAQPWPGNVRQLENVVERLVLLCDGPRISASDVSRALGAEPGAAPTAPPADTGRAATLGAERREAERAALVRALERAKNNRTLAARLLGVSRRTLYNKLEEHGLV